MKCSLTIIVAVKLATLVDTRLEVDPGAPEKARRIREGILTGQTTAAGKP